MILRAAAIVATVSGCHLASGIDDLKIDRTAPLTEKETFECEEFLDDFVTLDEDRWSEVDTGDGVAFSFDDANENLLVDIDDAPQMVRAGLISKTKYNLNNCSVRVEVDPTGEPTAFTMLALFVFPDDEEPLLAVRKTGGVLQGMRTGEVLHTENFNQNQLFWRLFDQGGQIRFEFSNVDGLYENFGTVAIPQAARGVHIALLAGSTDPVPVEDNAVFSSIAMELQ